MAAKVDNPDLRILFVTVDPDRDSDDNDSRVCQGLLAPGGGPARWTQRTGQSGAHLSHRLWVDKGPPGEVTHSSAVYFFDRDGKPRLVTTDTSNTAAMAEDVKKLLN